MSNHMPADQKLIKPKRSNRNAKLQRPCLKTQSTPRGQRRIKRWALYLLIMTALPVLMVRWVPPPISMFMIIDSANGWMTRGDSPPLQYQWVPLEKIADSVKLAVIASEDQTFLDHMGFDFKAIGKAFERNQNTKRIRGASTISQQTAKNLFLYPSRSYVRKGLEVYITALIEALWPKERILEVYLNIAEFGPKLYGIEAASRHFFQKPSAQLSSGEAALLAASLPNPKILKVQQPSAYLRQRQHWIQQQMVRLGGRGFLNDLSE